jgi:hypothetical protein
LFYLVALKICGKRVGQPLYFITGEGYHIETAIHSIKAAGRAGKPIPCGKQQLLLFTAGDAGSRATKVVAAAIAHFDKHNHLVLFHDEVDFAAVQMDVCSNEAQSFALKKAARLKLKVRACLLTTQFAGTIWP